jgi:putative redox protein
MVKITGTYQGQLRTEATHGPSGSRLITDAPIDNHGKGEAFSPTDLLATSLATCIVTTMGIVAERNGIDFSTAAFEVTKEMTSTPPRRVAKLTVRITMPAALSPESRKRLEAVAKTCPVHHSLHPDVVADVSFDYR